MPLGNEMGKGHFSYIFLDMKMRDEIPQIPQTTHDAVTSFDFRCLCLQSSISLEWTATSTTKMASLSLWETAPCNCEVSHFDSVLSVNGIDSLTGVCCESSDSPEDYRADHVHGRLAHSEDEHRPNLM